MQVLEHSKLFSDVHTPIVLYLVLPENTNVVLPKLLVDCKERIKPWDTDRKKIFLESIDSDQLYELLISLDNTCGNMEILQKETLMKLLQNLIKYI